MNNKKPFFEYYKGKNAGFTFLERDPVNQEVRLRRQKEQESWSDFFVKNKPEYFLTVTFNDAQSLRDFKYYNSAKARIAYEQAHKALAFFHKKILRKLLGPRYSKLSDAQPQAIAFMEFPSFKKLPDGGPYSPQNSPHFHAFYWMPDALVEKFDALDIELIWKNINPSVHRTAHIDRNDSDKKLINRSRYLTKQYPNAPCDYEYIILGKGELVRST